MFNPEVVLRRDRHLCRLRFPQCQRRATTAMLDVPEFLGGEACLSNARSACDSCRDRQLAQRERASALFGGS